MQLPIFCPTNTSSFTSKGLNIVPHRKSNPPVEQADYSEERIPFDQVLRKLVSAKPVHKVAAGPAKRKPSKPPKKG
jgi:hypothetical protein